MDYHTEKNVSSPIAREGLPFVAVPAILTLIAFWLGWAITGLVLLGVTLFVIAFFRNPEREISMDDRLVLSPADGRVTDVGEADEVPYIGGKAKKVGIFMSVYSVHINRSPVAGKVIAVNRGGSMFKIADGPDVGRYNVHVATSLETDKGVKITFNQITGFVARRIVNYLTEGDKVRQGQRIGLIRFGSRVDVYVPLGSEILVSVGDKVKGGLSILARLE